METFHIWKGKCLVHTDVDGLSGNRILLSNFFPLHIWKAEIIAFWLLVVLIRNLKTFWFLIPCVWSFFLLPFWNLWCFLIVFLCFEFHVCASWCGSTFIHFSRPFWSENMCLQLWKFFLNDSLDNVLLSLFSFLNLHCLYFGSLWLVLCYLCIFPLIFISSPLCSLPERFLCLLLLTYFHFCSLWYSRVFFFIIP